MQRRQRWPAFYPQTEVIAVPTCLMNCHAIAAQVAIGAGLVLTLVDPSARRQDRASGGQRCVVKVVGGWTACSWVSASPGLAAVVAVAAAFEAAGLAVVADVMPAAVGIAVAVATSAVE